MDLAEQPTPASQDGMAPCAGWCVRCQTVHSLPRTTAAEDSARELMKQMTKTGRIDFENEPGESRLSTTMLNSPHVGQMFGVLVARSGGGEPRVLSAFSGAFNGVWQVQGWVPPILDLSEVAHFKESEEKSIAELTAELESPPAAGDFPTRYRVQRQRRDLSRALMERLHNVTAVTNFRGEERVLREAFMNQGIPSGTGECCAPKLLHAAARAGMTPEAIAEFWWGASPEGGARKQGEFYPACRAKCVPLLGFLLCGAA